MSSVLLVTFDAGDAGQWDIQRILPVIGTPLPLAPKLRIAEGDTEASSGEWRLQGVVSNTRYSDKGETTALRAVSPALVRQEARCAALIPIKKTFEWWAMAQDERRAIFEERSGHISRSMKYLPAVARRLHHSRDLGEAFDFLTWFEFAPEHADDFDALLDELRASEEWRYVEREVDIRLTRA